MRYYRLICEYDTCKCGERERGRMAVDIGEEKTVKRLMVGYERYRREGRGNLLYKQLERMISNYERIRGAQYLLGSISEIFVEERQEDGITTLGELLEREKALPGVYSIVEDIRMAT